MEVCLETNEQFIHKKTLKFVIYSVRKCFHSFHFNYSADKILYVRSN